MSELTYAKLVGLDEILQAFKQKAYSPITGEEVKEIAGDVPTAIYLIRQLEGEGLVDPKWVEDRRPPAMIFLKDPGRRKIESGGFTGKIK